MTPIRVKVKPNARRSELTREADETWLARIKSAPVDGKANEELIALVARYFKVRASCVSIRSGAFARIKLLRIDGPTAD